MHRTGGFKKKLKNKQHKSLISDFKNYFYKAFALYLVFTFSTFSVYLGGSFFPAQSFWTRIKIICSELRILRLHWYFVR